MSLQMLFQNAAEAKRFEFKARSLGFSNFNRRGDMYCHADLNTLAAGYQMHMEITSKMDAIADSSMIASASRLAMHPLGFPA